MYAPSRFETHNYQHLHQHQHQNHENPRTITRRQNIERPISIHHLKSVTFHIHPDRHYRPSYMGQFLHPTLSQYSSQGTNDHKNVKAVSNDSIFFITTWISLSNYNNSTPPSPRLGIKRKKHVQLSMQSRTKSSRGCFLGGVLAMSHPRHQAQPFR